MYDFELEEATIGSIHEAYRSGCLTVRSLVESYVRRIEEYDNSGPCIHAVVNVNPHALAQADDLDEEFSRSGHLSGPLHGIPFLLKDQIETKGVPTTFGSVAFREYIPEKDAFVVRRLLEAGAVILAKTSMPDFASSFWSFSSLTGETRTPYSLEHDSGGSSAGCAAGLACNFCAVAVGEDTGGSVRVPGSQCCVVGVRPTPGLISRDGFSPLVFHQDTPGPMARTVWDAAALMDVLAGYDPADPLTASYLIARPPSSYTDSLTPNGLRGARLGLVVNALGSEKDPLSESVNQITMKAVAALRQADADVLEVQIPNLEGYIEATSMYSCCSRADINAFLKKRPSAPIHDIRALYIAGQYEPMLDLIEVIAGGPEKAEDDFNYYKSLTARESFTRILVNAMGTNGLDALIYPDVQIPPQTHDLLRSHRWTNNTYPTNTPIASHSWMPAMTVPAGFTSAGLPVGLEFVAKPYDEPMMFQLGYAFEQVTKHRRPPSSTPPI